MISINFKNCKLSFVAQLLIYPLIFIVVSRCDQDNHKKENDIALANFEYSAIQLFDPMWLDLERKMKQLHHIHIEKDPFILSKIKPLNDMNGANVNSNDDNLAGFDIGSLTMVGSIQHHSQWWGLLKTPNQAVHTISVGQLLDHDFYLVTAITSDEIYLLNVHTKSFNHHAQVKVLALNDRQNL